jgi:hypothetical protein
VHSVRPWQLAAELPLVLCTAYQQRSQAQGWADGAGLGLLAARAGPLAAPTAPLTDGRARPLTHRSFERTRRQLEKMHGASA